MKSEEDRRWEDFMRESRGKWTIDPIHNSQFGQDLLMFRAHPTRHGAGAYISVQQSGLATAGDYERAFPHIGKAEFNRRWEKKFGSFNAARSIVLERTLMFNARK